MPRQLLRVVETRRLDQPNDHKTPAEVQATDASAAHLEAYLQSVTTQLRRIMGTADWKADPPADLAYLLANLGVLLGSFVVGEELGPKNGVNLVFQTAHKFEPASIKVFWNGVRLHSGIGSDFVVSESGGVGTGYDTVTFAAPEMAPLPGESVLADYIEKP
jgi:hypothetical protein